MRTAPCEQLEMNWFDSDGTPVSPTENDELNQFATTVSGFPFQTPSASPTPNRISIYTLRKFFSSLSSNLRAASGLNINYWIFTILSCISFFACPWYLFLAFIIPALILLYMRVRQGFYQRSLNSKNSLSTSGT